MKRALLIGGAVVGVVLVTVTTWLTLNLVRTLYVDHQRVEAIWNLELQRAQQQQAKPPAQ